MKKPVKIAVVMFFIMLIGAITWHVLQPREPSYQRRRLTEWLNDYNGAGSMTRIEPTDQAIRAMGTNHLPYLLAHIEHTEAPDTYKRQAMVGWRIRETAFLRIRTRTTLPPSWPCVPSVSKRRRSFLSSWPLLKIQTPLCRRERW